MIVHDKYTSGFLCHFSLLFSALSYNIALTYYSLKNHNQALKYIGEIIDRGIKEHPGKNSCDFLLF